jgi:mRNA interferase MazF
MDKTRPVLLLTRDYAIGRLSTVTVAEITSTINGLDTELTVDSTNGLDHESVVNLDNVYTIRFEALGRRVGHLRTDQETALHAALVAAFDLEDR